MTPGTDTVVFIPAWNEEANLPAVLAELHVVVPDADVLVIDDGSTDATADVARGAGATVVSFGENRGLRAGIAAGYREAADRGYAFCGRVDADGQHPVEELARLLELVRSDTCDVAVVRHPALLPLAPPPRLVKSPAPRVIVVLGYSDVGRDELHPIGAARLARAAEVASENDVVVLSGWARVSGTQSEAELMAAGWKGLARELVVDPDARTTVGNATNALDDMGRVGAREVVVVTSRWHAPRAKAAFRLLLRGSGVRVVGAFPPEPRELRASMRELPLWALLPAQLFASRHPRTRAAD